jgi:hypothetical protein
LKNGKLEIDKQKLPSRSVGYTGTGNPEKGKVNFALKTIRQTSVSAAQNTQN